MCLTTDPQPRQKPVLHTVRSSASSFNFQYSFVSVSQPSSCLCLLPLLPVTPILPSIFLLITYFEEQLLHKLWPIHFIFLLFIGHRTFFFHTVTLCNPKMCHPRCVRSIIQSCNVYIFIYMVQQEERTRLREGVPYVKLYRYNPKHLYPKLNGYGDNVHRNVWASGVLTYCTPSVTSYLSIAHACPRHGNAVSYGSSDVTR